jgi:hypothetical protein
MKTTGLIFSAITGVALLPGSLASSERPRHHFQTYSKPHLNVDGRHLGQRSQLPHQEHDRGA